MLHVHKNIFIALWRCTKLSNITTEYRADFLGIYSLGWLSGLAVTGPHWRAIESIKFLKLQKIHFLKKSNMAAGRWMYTSLAFKGLRCQPRLMSHLAAAEPLNHIPFSFFKMLRRRRVTSTGEPPNRLISFFKALTSTDELSSHWAT